VKAIVSFLRCGRIPIYSSTGDLGPTPAPANRSRTRLFVEFLPGLLFQAVLWVLSWLPCSIAVPLARQLGRCRDSRPKELIELQRANMKTSLGAGDTQTREWIREVVELEAQEAYESWFFRRKSGKRILRKLLEIRGLEHLNEALARGQGAILCTSHARGLFKLLYVLATSGHTVKVIRAPRQPQINPFREWFELRRTLVHNDVGLNVLWMQRENFGVAVKAANALKRNEIVVTLLDVKTPTEGVRVEFLGRHVEHPIGPILIARTSGAPLLTCFVHPEPGGTRYIAEIGEPVYPGEDLHRTAQALAQRLEEEIRAYPSSYLFITASDFSNYGVRLDRRTARAT
jgi:KDO2-lipid IV(A) lauroyltransferase